MERTPKTQKEHRIPPVIKMKGLTTEAYQHILVEKAKLDAVGPRTRHVGEVAGICLNKFVEGKK